MTDYSELVERLRDTGSYDSAAYDTIPPVWAQDRFNGNVSEKCVCGAWREVVRPGKTQCVRCGDNYDVQQRLEAADAITALQARVEVLEAALETVEKQDFKPASKQTVAESVEEISRRLGFCVGIARAALKGGE